MVYLFSLNTQEIVSACRDLKSKCNFILMTQKMNPCLLISIMITDYYGNNYYGE